MSIIIEGMEMPKDGRLLISIHSDGCVYQSVYDMGFEKVDCAKAKELPPHGRLKDADALIDMINQSITEQEKVYNSIKEDPIGKHGMWIDIMHDKRIISILEDAPTIIEAEE